MWGTPTRTATALFTLGDIAVPAGRRLIGTTEGSLLESATDIVAGANRDLFASGDSVVDGDDPIDLGDTGLSITFVRYRSANNLQISENGAGNFETLYSTGGTYEDREFHFQIDAAGTLVTLTASDINAGGSAANRVRWDLSAQQRTDLQSLDEDSRFILFITEPTAVADTEATGALTLGLGIALAATAAIQAVANVEATGAIDLGLGVTLAATASIEAPPAAPPVEATGAITLGVGASLAATAATRDVAPVEATGALTLGVGVTLGATASIRAPVVPPGPATDATQDSRLHALLAIAAAGGTLYRWTGAYDLGYGGNLYVGGRVYKVGSGGGSSLSQTNRLGFSIAVREDERMMWLRDVGAPPVTVNYIASEDGGENWAEVSVIKGRISNPVLTGLSYTFNVVGRTPLADQGRIRYWSHEEQQQDYPGDQGLAQMATLAAEGVTVAWPVIVDTEPLEG